MQVINARNVNEALYIALLHFGNPQAVLADTSRNGPVSVLREPVCTVYAAPLENVLLSPTRDANPFFHFFESLWMLRGRSDVEFPARFVKRMKEFSDDGLSFWGAYGYRWREWFGVDQLRQIIGELRHNPASRRIVLSMWDPGIGTDRGEVAAGDFAKATNGGKDVPCNTHAYFSIRDGVLDMMVCNRSNDALWGCYGANAVHFAMLQAYVAAGVGVPVGTYRQVTNNLHIYTDTWDAAKLAAIHSESITASYRVASLVRSPKTGEYRSEALSPFSGGTFGEWNTSLVRFFNDVDAAQVSLEYPHRFFNDDVRPMWGAFLAYKKGLHHEAITWANAVLNPLWSQAATEWLMRRDPAVKAVRP